MGVAVLAITKVADGDLAVTGLAWSGDHARTWKPRRQGVRFAALAMTMVVIAKERQRLEQSPFIQACPLGVAALAMTKLRVQRHHRPALAMTKKRAPAPLDAQARFGLYFSSTGV